MVFNETSFSLGGENLFMMRLPIIGSVLLPALVLLAAGSFYTSPVQAEKSAHKARRVQVIIPTSQTRKAGTVTRLSVRYTGSGYRPGPPLINAAQHRNWRTTVSRAAKKYLLEPALLNAVISVESSFDPDALSPAGAMGLMQLMPETAERFAVEDPYNPVANINAGARYLRILLDRFDTIELALAAYNAGENAVLNYGRRIPPYPETQNYVTRVLSYYAYFQKIAG
jgi:soluble lytic murein transglycosylase-like protein